MYKRINSFKPSSSISNIINGDFPPSSKLTRLRLLLAEASWIFLPTTVEPVKAILFISMWCERAEPALSP
jgi:hypothetical protein